MSLFNIADFDISNYTLQDTFLWYTSHVQKLLNHIKSYCTVYFESGKRTVIL